MTTEPVTSTFSGLILEVQDTTMSPPVWVARMCGFSENGLALKATTSTGIVPPCDDPEAAAWDVTGVSSLGAQITLTGVSASEDEDFWHQWFDTGQPLNARWRKSGVGYRSGQLLLTDLGESAKLRQDANLTQRSITLQNASAFPYTSGDPAP